MNTFPTGLSLVLGRMLTAWCEQLEPPTLERYLEIGGFQGLARAGQMSSLEVLAELRASRLRERGPAAEPVFRLWQRFLARQGEGVLVVDATAHDQRSASGAFLLTQNPFGLVEGLLIAALASGADTCRLLLPPPLHPYEAGLLNAFESVQARKPPQARRLELELVRDPVPSIYSGGQPEPASEAQLALHLETWYHLALVFSLGADRFNKLGLEDHSGTWLLTVGGPLQRPGVVEAPLGGSLWQAVETLAGGVGAQAKPLALALDDGMGGFLPPGRAEIPLAPEELGQYGVCPAPMTLWLLEDKTCLLQATRQALYRYWRLAGEETSPERVLIARAARMVTEITVGRGWPTHLEELERLGRQMAAQGLAAAWPLLSALRYFPEQWQEHLAGQLCPSRQCLERKPAPCHSTCPAGIDIPSFLAMIGHQDYKGATRVIPLDNPLPYVCGLVCPAPCEGACLRGEMDQPISIRAMKAVAAKHSLAAGGYPKPRLAKASGQRVAVVGSGPAGLTAAFFLAKRGHQVTIFEAQAEAGGMLRYGIPAYRLPREVLNQELEQITRLGVVIETGREIENLEQLRRQGFQAIFLALGTQLSRLIPIEGADQPFVLGGLDFLKEVRGGQNPRVGPRVVVVGGGNVAIDVALTAVRQGGHRVDMVCLEKRREMPAHISEIETALAEGVAIHNSWGPTRITEQREAFFQQCTRVFDERGRFSPQFNPERTMSIKADQVILAIGQATDLACVEAGSLVQVQRGLICTEEETLQTQEEGVFAGGDVVHGPRTVVEAIRAGKQAAASIDAYLQGRKVQPDVLKPKRRAEVEPLPVSARDRNQLKRPDMPMREVEDRKGNFLHIELGLTDQMALGEASRCLRCDLCIGCGLCQLVCSEVGAEALRLNPTKADRLAFNDFTRPATRCIGCGACAQVCPTGAILLTDRQGVRSTVLTGSVVRQQQLITCSGCGGPFVSQAYLDHLRGRVGPEVVPHVERRLCPACVRQLRAEELAGRPFNNVARA